MGLGSILGTIGGIVGAPFTGGASLALGPALGGLGDVLGDAAKGSGQAALQGGNLALGQGALQKSLYDAAMQRALTQASLPSLGAKQAAAGDLLSNVQDVTASGGSPELMAHLVKFSGGIRPSALGPNARQAGANLSAAGLKNQSLALPQVPNMPEMPSTLLPNILGAGALSANLIAALSKFGANKPATGFDPASYVPYGPPDPNDPWNGDPSVMGGG